MQLYAQVEYCNRLLRLTAMVKLLQICKGSINKVYKSLFKLDTRFNESEHVSDI